MLFYNSLYKIISSEKNDAGFNMKLEINHSHPIFKGHFPGSPVLPGVVMLHIIRECVETTFDDGSIFDFKEIKQCKFPMPIAMEEDRTVLLNFSVQQIDDMHFNLSATMKDESAIFAILKSILLKTNNE